ncbi:hypothetical protein BU15DRAFT_75972 [Melanogaster broomeanus]|nr:hypothetical protein BU15DRAFT_75972 [Melanogaster broomeanus]
MSQRVGGDRLTQGAFPKWKGLPRSALHRTCGGDLALSGGTSSPGYPRSHEMDVANGTEGWGPHDLAERGGRAAPLSSPFHHLPIITPSYQSSNMVESSADNPGNALQATREEPYTKDELKSLKKQDLVALVTRQIDKWPYPMFQPATTTAELLRSLLLNPVVRFTKTITNDAGVHSGDDDAAPEAAPESSEGAWDEVNDGKGEPASQDALDCDETEQSYEATNPLVDPAEGQDTQQEVLTSPEVQPVRTSSIVSLPEVESASCKADEWKVSTVDLLQQLQMSSAAIDDSGPLRLSCPDPLDAQYRWCFLTTGPGKTILDTAPETLTLTVTDDQQDNHRVQIIVDQVHQPALPLLPVPQQSTDSHLVLSTRPPVSRMSDTEGTVEQVQWLKIQAETRPGYEAFKNAQHRTRGNLGIVAAWKFAADFSHEFNKTSSARAGVPGVFTKEAIQQALGVRGTWLSEAETATAVLSRCGPEGTEPDQDVVQMLTSGDPLGRKALYTSLKQYQV